MPTLPDITVAECLHQIQTGDLVLPAIQREFVWKPVQIIALFDSLLRGYPIGTFLSWRVEPDTANQFRFYGFLRDYNELNGRHNPVLDLPPQRPVTAVLDGQQRLTSLNIALRGTYASRKKWGRQISASYPPQTLFLNLARKAAPENADGLEFDFRFLTKQQLETLPEEEARYFLPIPAVYNAKQINTLLIELSTRGIANNPLAMEMATELWTCIHTNKFISFFQETHQDIERVLDIFIRLNSAGTTLSYSDLLLSIATAQWTARDARAEITDLLDGLNNTTPGFRFSRDQVLKSGLALAGVNDMSFKVKNFTSSNMQALSDQWDEISASLHLAVDLFSDFGLSGATITAGSVLVPIAMYLHHRGLDQSYRTAPQEAQDRAALKSWTMRMLVLPGIWGSGLDVLLRAIRETIYKHGDNHFPATEIDREMTVRGKTVITTPEVVESLLDLQYRDAKTFAVLAILFPHVNTRNVHHIDHIFPASLLGTKKLRQQGFGDSEIKKLQEAKDGLANLELLEGAENISKSATTPALWAKQAFVPQAEFEQYLYRNAIPASLPRSTGEFLEFYGKRRELLRRRLLDILGDGREKTGVTLTPPVPSTQAPPGRTDTLLTRPDGPRPSSREFVTPPPNPPQTDSESWRKPFAAHAAPSEVPAPSQHRGRRPRTMDWGQPSHSREALDASLSGPETPSGSSPLLFLRQGNAEGTGRLTSSGFVVYAGAQLERHPGRSCPSSASAARDQYADFINPNYLLTEDVHFHSPSAAANFLTLISSNGRLLWKTAEGVSLRDL